jgi:Flp pilus assembly protein TadB
MSATNQNSVKDRQLERQGKRMERPAIRFLLLALIVAIPGVIVVVLGPLGIGAAILLLACVPATVGIALLVSSGFARWAARHKLLA